MLKKLVALSLVFGVILADPIGKTDSLSPTREYVGDVDDAASYEVAKTDASSLILSIIPTLVAFKETALVVAVKIIGWLVANAVIIVFGAIATLGVCKLTDKCNFIYNTYDQFVPALQIRNLVTPEQLETAENFLTTAVEKYAEERRERAIRKNRKIMW